MLRKDGVLLAALLLLAAVLHFAVVDRDEIWLDEARSLQDSVSMSGMTVSLSNE